MYKQPLNVNFELTDSCNNDCTHCYASSWIKTTSRSGENALKVAKSLAEYDIFDVILTGGEPLLIPLKELSHIIDIFFKKNISLSLNTNGRLLNTNTCKELRRHGLTSVLISCS
ncbi:radical SAM protein [Thermodesulfobacteriota bacterium]